MFHADSTCFITTSPVGTILKLKSVGNICHASCQSVINKTTVGYAVSHYVVVSVQRTTIRSVVKMKGRFIKTRSVQLGGV